MDEMMEGVVVTPLRIIPGELGDVMHALKKNESAFQAFGEAYFSTVKKGKIKGWKKHHRMIQNLIVPMGKIKVVVFDDRPASATQNTYFKVILSPSENYARLTIHPGVWVAFEGIENHNIVLNLASIEHDPTEADVSEVSSGKINYPRD